ncbi:hypothetical protein TcG_04360 [Trypanosoma cruzi]|nr:hypothetical protein TcG_04360 [Trypanosoma cruzi]
MCQHVLFVFKACSQLRCWDSCVIMPPGNKQEVPCRRHLNKNCAIETGDAAFHHSSLACRSTVPLFFFYNVKCINGRHVSQNAWPVQPFSAVPPHQLAAFLPVMRRSVTHDTFAATHFCAY